MISDIDDFSVLLFEQSKRFLEKSKQELDQNAKKAFLNAALVIGVSALEAHVNAIADEMINTHSGELEKIEISILGEKEIEFSKGEFCISEKLMMYRLLDRIEFIMKRFSVNDIVTTHRFRLPQI